jgi:hypothetical protein
MADHPRSDPRRTHPIKTRPRKAGDGEDDRVNRTTDFTCRSAVLILPIFRSLLLWSIRVLFVESLSILFLL